MLEHCFWLLEFKFKFEFYLFESFQNCLNLLLSTPILFHLSARHPFSWPSAQWPPAGPASRFGPAYRSS
jgi:hypothetical protein